jgi:hypothetical protein
MVKGLVISIAAIAALLLIGFIAVSIWTVLFDNPGTA